SEDGAAWIQKEYHRLKRLTEKYPYSYLPEVFGIGAYESSHKPVRMFLGEWLEGYHEFHHVPEGNSGETRIQVWYEEKGRFFLNDSQEVEAYRQISHILTRYYDIHTFEAISSWHHAAGDFVIRTDENSIRVKLISVRNYAPMIKAHSVSEKIDAKPAFLLHALLLFFLNLSICIRLDRIEGVGETVWADEAALEGLMLGFYSGLEMNPTPEGFPASISDCFKAYLLQGQKADFDSLLSDVATHHIHEAPFIRGRLKRHGETLYDLFLKHL
ncbi:MAG: hypothetical protein AB1659_03870, partial [Thermodesulfobacteriota bacterium]